MFRVIVAGGRDFDNYALLTEVLDLYLSPIKDDIAIVCGKARGADTLGEKYAKEHGYSVMAFPAQWKRYGKPAGYIRNKEMAKNADALVAFWDGQSRGTHHMIKTAMKNCLDIRIIPYAGMKGKDCEPK